MYAGDHSTIADQVERLLIQNNVQFFQRSGELVRPISVRLPAAHGAKTTAMHLREVNPTYARDVMSRLIDFLRYDARAKEWKPAVAPLAIAATMIERKAEWKFRNIVGVISTPTMRPDGSLLIVEGHDATTDLLLVDPPEMPAIPDKPTRADAVTALNSLKELFAEFPYVDRCFESGCLERRHLCSRTRRVPQRADARLLSHRCRFRKILPKRRDRHDRDRRQDAGDVDRPE